MIVSDPSVFVHDHDTPDIDPTEARWAAEYLSLMIDRLGPDSPVGLVLRQTRRELASLTQAAPATVIGPLRIAA
jgi:hypothetical protein